MNRKGGGNKAAGFSLIELSIVMIIIGILLTTVARLAPTLILTSKDKANRAILTQYQLALRGYLASHYQLPCPDGDSDGVADATCADTGTVPYITLGLASSLGKDAYDNALRYGVYRASGEDLTATTSMNQVCGTLRRAAATALDNGKVYVGSGNIPFGLASAGRDNAFATDNTGTQFAASDTPISSTYDDMTASDSFNELYSLLNCGVNEKRLKIVTGENVTWKSISSLNPLTFDASGGVPPYYWCIASSGIKPGNVTMDPDDWTASTSSDCVPTTAAVNNWMTLSCSGTCTTTPTTGTYMIRIYLTDSKGETAKSSVELTIQ